MDWFNEILNILQAAGITVRVGKMWRGGREEVFLALEGVALEDLISGMRAEAENGDVE